VIVIPVETEGLCNLARGEACASTEDSGIGSDQILSDSISWPPTSQT
jgi:hypothetical protein